MDNILVTALYCDDFRQEVGGKVSYMGVYNTDLVVPEFPTTVAKLCVHVTVRIPLGAKANNLTIRVLVGEQQVAEVALPEGELSKAVAASAGLDVPPENRCVTIALGLQFAPLKLDQPGIMRVRAIVDGTELKGNALILRLPTDSERAMLPSV